MTEKDPRLFEHLLNFSYYRDNPVNVARLRKRHAFLVDPFRTEIEGARVLDIAAHDGRWSYAFAQAGAASVLGIEAREELAARFDEMPDTPQKERVSMQVGDLYVGLDELVRENEKFDVIALFGIMYHVMDHFRILRQCMQLSPRVVIVDGEFMKGDNPYIQLVKERTDKFLNAAPQIEGQSVAIKGILSSVAMERIAEALGCSIQWLPWEFLPQNDRRGVRDYFRGSEEKMIRRTCALRPNSLHD